MDILSKSSGQEWVAVGDQANWERGIENGIWGIIPDLESQRKKIERNDLLLVYCKTPIELRTEAYLADLVFEVLKKHGVGLVFSRWTWLPPPRKQFAKLRGKADEL